MKRKIYLSMKPLQQAKEIWFSQFKPDQRTSRETVSTNDASGRVTAGPVFARWSAPSFHSAAMDGIAVRAEDTFGTTERSPKTLELGRDAIWINTGQPLPKGFDSIIMVEKLHQVDEGHVEIRSPSHPWQHVRKVGEDIVATQLLLPHNHKIRPYDLGTLISGGVFELDVWEKPKVAIIPTGSELVYYENAKKDFPQGEDKTVEFNSIVLSATVEEYGGIPQVYGIIPDIEEEIRKTLESAVDSDAHIVIVNAGSSAGSMDFTAHLIAELGEVLVHGVAMMPGKPTILGTIKGKPVVGNPGYAVSSILSFDQFIKPLLFSLQGIRPYPLNTIRVQPTRDIPSKLGIEEFLRVNIGRVGANYLATPLQRAAGSITTLTRAEGIVRIPASSEGISKDEIVDAELFIDEKEIDRTIVVTGSHDLSIDILADELGQRGGYTRISSSNVGSLGGLIALKNGMCHMAGSHLLDIQTGEYNISYVLKYLAGMKMSLFNLVFREQGLILAKGNPKGIKGIEDLSRKDVTFINRQAGSGTRVFLDYKLDESCIDQESIRGYQHEEFTHMAVAVGVLSGLADCGLGIFAAAKALGLDFIPLERENYDLIIPTQLLNEPHVKNVLEAIKSNSFRKRVSALGGYDPSKSGTLWMET